MGGIFTVAYRRNMEPNLKSSALVLIPVILQQFRVYFQSEALN